THISLGSIFKTVDLVFGLPPLNLYDAAATDLLEIFRDPPEHNRDHDGDDDDAPYRCAEVNRDHSKGKSWLEATKYIDFRAPDAEEAALGEAIRLSEGIPPSHKAESGSY